MNPIYTYDMNGNLIDMLNLPSSELEISRIAKTLSKINRFNGRTRWEYSVAQHSIACYKHALKLAPLDYYSFMFFKQMILHDSAEAIFGDVIRPIKIMCSDMVELENRVLEQIFSYNNVYFPLNDAIHMIDDIVLDMEIKFFFKNIKSNNTIINTMCTASQAEEAFLACWNDICEVEQKVKEI